MPEHFSYADTNEQRELRERPVRMLNAVVTCSYESDFPDRPMQGEFRSEDVIEVHNTPLLQGPRAVVFGVPHAGEYIPADLWDAMDSEQREIVGLSDHGTARIFHGGELPSVLTHMTRFVGDANRHPVDGQALYPTQAPGIAFSLQSPANDKPLYVPGRQPSAEDIARMKQQWYGAYYQKMLGVVGTVADSREPGAHMLLVDGHSFPPEAGNALIQEWYAKYGIETVSDWPLFILGDQDGKRCDPRIMQMVTQALHSEFQQLGVAEQHEFARRVPAIVSGRLAASNQKLKGVHNVAFWGMDRQETRVSALQMEIHEGAYMDGKLYNKELLYNMQQLVQRALLRVEDQLLHGAI